MGFVELIVAVLTGIFVYFKIKDHKKIGKWSWWRVLSPLWIYGIYLVVILVIFMGFFGIAVSSIGS